VSSLHQVSRFLSPAIHAKLELLGRARIPIALHVCRDSREVAKEVYELSFGLKGFSQPGGSSWMVEPKIYFSFDRDTLFIDTEGSRPCGSLRGMSFEMLRAEAHRFHCLAKQVQDLAKVRTLAAWEYLPMVAVHGVSIGERGEVRNPWSAFEGIEGEAMGVGVANQLNQVYDKDLTVAEPNPLEGIEWDLEQDVNLITGLKWKQTWLVAR
jgi:2EXR family